MKVLIDDTFKEPFCAPGISLQVPPGDDVATSPLPALFPLAREQSNMGVNPVDGVVFFIKTLCSGPMHNGHYSTYGVAAQQDIPLHMKPLRTAVCNHQSNAGEFVILWPVHRSEGFILRRPREPWTDGPAVYAAHEIMMPAFYVVSVENVSPLYQNTTSRAPITRPKPNEIYTMSVIVKSIILSSVTGNMPEPTLFVNRLSNYG